MKRIIVLGLASLYSLGGVATFGHVWNRIDCDQRDLLTCEDRRGFPSIVAAMFWPLTLSVIAQEDER